METVKCGVCGKKIVGWTIKHVDYLLKAHTLAKHNKKRILKEE